MPSIPDVHPISSFKDEPWDASTELLFKEARARQRRRRRRGVAFAVLVVGIAASAMAIGVTTAGPSSTSSGSSASVLTSNNGVKVITCTGARVVRPSTLIISCADANTLLTATHWSTWNAKGATGTTRFGMNLCTPYCAASPITYFPHSTVSLSAPLTSHRATYFSQLVVHYVMGSARKTFDFSWRGSTPR